MNKNLVIFGPWCGEFCYELSWWIPEIRKQRYTQFKDYDAIAVSHEGRKILYSDFTKNYIHYPSRLEDTLKYPATYGEHVNGRDIIPKNLQQFVKDIADMYKKQYEKIVLYMPGTMPITRARVMDDHPFGEYKHYNASDEITHQMK